MPEQPLPITTRILENPTGEWVYIIVEQMQGDNVDGELMRLRAHLHPPGTPRTATESNRLEVDETGNQHDLRRKYIEVLLDYRDKKWKKVGGNLFGSTPKHNFWSLENL